MSRALSISLLCMMSILFLPFTVEAKLINVPKRQFHIMLSQEEWAHIGDPEKLQDDVIILKGGKVLYGKFESLPPVELPFGKVDFTVDEVAALAFATDEPIPKVQYVTRNGQNYIGVYRGQVFPFKEKILVHEKDSVRELLPNGRRQVQTLKSSSSHYYIQNMLDPKAVQTIVFAPRKEFSGKKIVGTPLVDPLFFSVVLQDGSRFPVEIPNYDWHFTRGNEEYEVPVARVINLKVDPVRGIEGQFKGESLEKRIYFDGAKEDAVHVILAKDGTRFTIPWKLIKEVRGDMGMFILETPYFFGQPRIGNMIYVPGGSFLLGSKVRPNSSLKGFPKLVLNFPLGQFAKAQLFTPKNFFPTIETPVELVKIQGFYMDKFEVSNHQYFVFVLATGHRVPPHWKNGMYPEEQQNLPVTNVSYEDALAYATWVGKRLPTEEEWERAAKGPLGLRYPYGDDFDPLQANVMGETTLPVGTFSAFYDTTSFAPGEEPYDIYDLSGNVAEWTASIFAPYGQATSTARAKGYLVPVNGQHERVVRGGSYKSSPQTATSTYRTSTLETDFNAYTGFRCVWDPRQTQRP
jgi:iron(II)-dependent oxidoreductase